MPKEIDSVFEQAVFVLSSEKPRVSELVWEILVPLDGRPRRR
jgi:hypothetical protein